MQHTIDVLSKCNRHVCRHVHVETNILLYIAAQRLQTEMCIVCD